MTQTQIAIPLVLGAILVLSGIFLFSNLSENQLSLSQFSQSNQKPESSNKQIEPTEPSIENEEISPSPAPTNTPDQLPTRQTRPTNSPTIQPETSNNLYDKLIYPGAQITLKTSNNMRLTTNNNAKLVGDWYKDTLEGLGMQNRSFVTTSVNNNYTGNLSGYINSIKVIVTIDQDSFGAIINIQ